VVFADQQKMQTGTKTLQVLKKEQTNAKREMFPQGLAHREPVCVRIFAENRCLKNARRRKSHRNLAESKICDDNFAEKHVISPVCSGINRA